MNRIANLSQRSWSLSEGSPGAGSARLAASVVTGASR